MKRCVIWGREVELQGSPLTLLVFKKEFDCDLAVHLSSSYKKDILDIEDFLKVAWAMAKTYSDEVDPYEDWLSQFDPGCFSLTEIPIEVISSAINAELFCSMSTIQRIKRAISRWLGRLAKRACA